MAAESWMDRETGSRYFSESDTETHQASVCVLALPFNMFLQYVALSRVFSSLTRQ